ncbi:uncharacterized protein LOC119983359 isoform X3 [Tripterygium wilfordii]|uniref:uncharacterized protein LOC119983359 isoform X3 n=1 Tax=Tripterygium wilfordii TaxID=458696 RepID=UPI0018F85D04|nr:uncharacterized protein LOC119983359 isoform X3 [Tripterygium wilfordii]
MGRGSSLRLRSRILFHGIVYHSWDLADAVGAELNQQLSNSDKNLFPLFGWFTTLHRQNCMIKGTLNLLSGLAVEWDGDVGI